MDKIIISEAQYFCFINYKGKLLKQKIIIDLEIAFNFKNDLKANIKSELITCDELNKVIERNLIQEYESIDIIAEKLAFEILNNFNTFEVLIRIKIPHYLKNIKYYCIEIIRFKKEIKTKEELIIENEKQLEAEAILAQIQI